MRVVILSGVYPPCECGVGDYTSRLVDFLSKKNDASIFVLTKKSKINSNESNVCRGVEAWSYRNLPSLICHLYSLSPNIVHIQYPSSGFIYDSMPIFLPFILKLFGFKVVATWHEPVLKVGLGVLLQLYSLNFVIVVSNKFFVQSSKKIRRLVWVNKFYTIPIGNNIPVVSFSEKDIFDFRKGLLAGQSRLLVFFGLIESSKNIELVFDIGDPETDYILIVGAVRDDGYRKVFEEFADNKGWTGKYKISGFLDRHHVSKILKAADAVILPYKNGVRDNSGSWLAAVEHGAFVLTTSMDSIGYDLRTNTYIAKHGDVEEMSRALTFYCGVKREGIFNDQWNIIAEKHYYLYKSIMSVL